MLEILLIMFIVLAVVSGLGISLLYLVRNQKSKTIIFYFLSALAMLIAFINATSLPSNFIIQQLVAWSLGFISIIAIVLKLKKPEKSNLAYLLVSLSVALGLFNLFFI